MRSWQHVSPIIDMVVEEDLAGSTYHVYQSRTTVGTSERITILQNNAIALQRLQLALIGNENELQWVNQLAGYNHHLQKLPTIQTAEEQFNCLYQLRKWLFWVPVALLQRQGGQGPAMLTLAHFYATALSFEALFPDLGPSFCSAIALRPLESIIGVTDAMQTEWRMDASSTEIGSVMQYPRETALSYRMRTMQNEQAYSTHESPSMDMGPSIINYASTGNLSPAFAPSPLHYSPVQTTSQSHAPFLEVPTSFSYGTQGWNAMPSPGLPPFAYIKQEGEQLYDFGGVSLGDYHGGFVPMATAWT